MKRKSVSLVIGTVLVCSGIVFFSCSSSQSIAPQWVYDKESVFPKKTYISGLGEGLSKETAKNNAIAEISRYLQTSVDSSIQTNFRSESNNGITKTNQEIIRNVTVSSKSTLSGLSYTNAYFNKNEKRWYCTAYISREDAWKSYKPEIEQAKMEFYAIYEKIPKTNPLKALSWYQKVQKASDALLEKLIFASVIDSDKERVLYISDRQKIAELSGEITSLKEEISVFIDLRNDDSNLIQTELKSIFSDLGFQIKDSKILARYIAKSEIILNEQKTLDDGDTIFSENPAFSLLIFDSNDSFYQYSAHSEKKILSFSQNDAHKKAVRAIYEVIKKELKADITAKLAE